MVDDVDNWVKWCERCNLVRTPQPCVRTSMGHLLASCKKPLQVLAMDFTTLEPAGDCRENVLVMTNVFTIITKAVATKDQRATTTAKLFVKQLFLPFGVHLRIHSHHGRNFESEVVTELCRMYAVKKSRTTPYYSEGDGRCGRFNWTLHCLLIVKLPPHKTEGDQDTCQKYCMPTILHLMPQQDNYPITCCYVRSLVADWHASWNIGGRTSRWWLTGSSEHRLCHTPKPVKLVLKQA